MPLVQIALYAVLGIALAISAATDLKSRLIYNVITFPTMILTLLLRVGLVGWTSPDPRLAPYGLLSGLIGFAVGFGLFWLMSIREWVAMGDVKLMGAVGAGLGFPVVLYALMFISLAGGLLAVVVLLWEGSLLKTFGNMGKRIAHVLRIKRIEGQEPEHKYVPYGVAIAIGSAWAVYYDLSHPLLD